MFITFSLFLGNIKLLDYWFLKISRYLKRAITTSQLIKLLYFTVDQIEWNISPKTNFLTTEQIKNDLTIKCNLVQSISTKEFSRTPAKVG